MLREHLRGLIEAAQKRQEAALGEYRAAVHAEEQAHDLLDEYTRQTRGLPEEVSTLGVAADMEAHPHRRRDR